MLLTTTKYSYNDISIVPATISSINSRSECNPYVNNYLPIFTAPMSSVVNLVNYELFEENKIHSIIPRNISFEARLDFLKKGIWCAFSLKEAESLTNNPLPTKSKILIDIANGHMSKLFNISKKIKSTYPDINLMIGNVGNPDTVLYLKQYFSGIIDYIRVGIGSGFSCITSSNTGVHYPMASLIDECKNVKGRIKIVADGGIRNYSDIIKALALGADYVMVGSVFASLIESAGITYYYDALDQINIISPFEHKIDRYPDCWGIDENGGPEIMYKRFYGMASSRGQMDLNGYKNKTAEGIEKEIVATTTIKKWSENMTDYLKSAMSYVGAYNLNEFINSTNCIVVSNNTYNSINK